MVMRKLKAYRKLFLVFGVIFSIYSFFRLNAVLNKRSKRLKRQAEELQYIKAITANPFNEELHVITNYPLMTEKPWNEGQTESNISRLLERQEEIEETLEKNLNHSLVEAVHLLVNQPLAEQRLKEQNFHNKHKIFIHRINALPKYRDFFEYANNTLQNKLVVMMNMDIYLGEGFGMINKAFLAESNVSYILTRHGRREKRCNMVGRPGYCEVSYFGSHDAYIFILTQGLNESVLVELDYDMNVLGAENKLIWVLRNKLNRKLLNPCRYLKTYHNHCVDIHGSVRPRINKEIHGKNGDVNPGWLLSKATHLHKSFNNTQKVFLVLYILITFWIG